MNNWNGLENRDIQSPGDSNDFTGINRVSLPQQLPLGRMMACREKPLIYLFLRSNISGPQALQSSKILL